MNGVDALRDCRRSLVVSLGMAGTPFYGHRMWRNEFGFGEQASNRSLVSPAAVRAMVRSVQASALRFYEYLFAHDLVYAAVPAPRPQARHRGVQLFGVPALLELNALYEEPVRTLLAEHDCPLVVPDGVLTEDGLLKETYWSEDPSHGNLANGVKVIEALDALSAKRTAEPEPTPKRRRTRARARS